MNATRSRRLAPGEVAFAHLHEAPPDAKGRPKASVFRVKNLVALRRALDAHNARCDESAEAILLNPIDHGLLRWYEL